MDSSQGEFNAICIPMLVNRKIPVRNFRNVELLRKNDRDLGKTSRLARSQERQRGQGITILDRFLDQNAIGLRFLLLTLGTRLPEGQVLK